LDAKALMVDLLTKDIYLVTKEDSSSQIFRAAYPQSTRHATRLERVAALPFGWVVSADISPAGDEILIKTYTAIYYWRRAPEQNLAELFETVFIIAPYIWETQGEAVGWKADGKGYYTISEEFGGVPARLYFYPRLSK
jgi:hypothetical protein